MLKEGDKLPNFELFSDTNENIQINDFIGKSLIIYFYPKDDTPGCTLESLGFSCSFDAFGQNDTVIIGISKDSVQKHEKFKRKYDLKQILLSDSEGKICALFGCWVEKSMYGKKYMGIERSTFLIDKNGIIRKIWKNVKVPGHVEEVLKHSQELNNA